MNEENNGDLALINPNWSAFVLLPTMLSVFNQLARLLLPLSDDAEAVLRTANFVATLVLWAAFIYLLRMAPNRHCFITAQRGWVALLGSMPFRRFLRLLWFRLILRVNKRRFHDFLSRIHIKQDAQGTLLFILFVVIVIFEISVGSILRLEEGQPGSTITPVSDAVWWAVVTVSTVGYGDDYPVTSGGRLIAMLLMALGIAFFSVIRGSHAEWFGRLRDADQDSGCRGRTAGTTSITEAIEKMKALMERQEEDYLETVKDNGTGLFKLEATLQREIISMGELKNDTSGKCGYVTKLEMVYGAPSQNAYDSAVSSEQLPDGAIRLPSRGRLSNLLASFLM